MNVNGVLEAVRGFLGLRDNTCGLGELDFALLRTAMLLAAVDGTVGEEEVDFFKQIFKTCRGFDEKTFDRLWKVSLRSAGYLFLQSRFLSGEALVAAFLEETEDVFVKEVILEPTAERKRVFDCLEHMAAADGVYSDIERACITALARRVDEARKQALADRYPRAARYDEKNATA